MKLFFAFNKHPHSLLSLTQCGKQKNVWGLCGKERQRETERGRKRGRETEREKHTEKKIERKYPYFQLVLPVFIRIKTKWITIICLFNVKYVFKYTPGY